MLTFLDNLLIGQEDVAVQVADEVAYEFVSCFCIFVFEYVHELVLERGKQI